MNSPRRAMLSRRRCRPLPAGSKALTAAAMARLLPQVPGWRVAEGSLCRTFRFADFHQTMAFVNAVAWVAHAEDHHPDLAIAFNRCTVSYNTHSIGGISMNDFICAARINALMAGAPVQAR